MSGHYHNPNSGSQNVGNSLGSRSSVRQSKLYRKHESGNGIKAVLGVSHLAWDQDEQQGAYAGHGVWDAEAARPTHSRHPPRRVAEDHEPYYAAGRRKALPARASLSDYDSAEVRAARADASESGMYPTRLREDRGSLAPYARHPPAPEMDSYERYERRPSAEIPLSSALLDRDTYKQPRAYDRPAYEQSSYPDRGYDRSGYASRPAHTKPAYERDMPVADRSHYEAPRSYMHHPAADASRHPSIPSDYGMRASVENENISNFTAPRPRAGYDRDMEYAALNAKVSDAEKRMVMAAKTRPW